VKLNPHLLFRNIVLPEEKGAPHTNPKKLSPKYGNHFIDVKSYTFDIYKSGPFRFTG
jgi:hypothetical protein